MTNRVDTKNVTLLCDFEKIALGVPDAHCDQFDIGEVIDWLLR